MASRGEIEAGAAYVRLFLKDGLTGGLKRASATLKSWGSSIRNMGMKLMAIGGAMTAPFLLAVKSFTAYGDAINDMATRTGMSVEALSELGFAAEQSGIDLQTLEIGLKGMARAIDSASRGTKTTVDTLEMLGLTFEQIRGQSPETQFLMLADALSRMDDPTTRAALAMQMFGKSGQKLIPLMAGGAAGIRELQAEAARLGITLSGRDAKAAAAMDDAWQKLKATFQGVKNTIGAALAPTFLQLSETIQTWSERILKIIKDNKTFVVGLFKAAVAVTAIGAGLVVLGTGIVALGAVFGAAAAVVSGLGAVLGVVGTALAVLISPIGLVVAGVVGLAGYFAWTSGAVGESIDWLKSKFNELRDWTGQVFEGIRNAMAAGDIALAGEILMAALKLVWTKGINALKETWIGFKDKILSVWSAATYKIAAWGTQAWAGLRSGWAETVAGMQILWIDFTNSIQNNWEGAQKTIAKGIAWILAKIEGLDPAAVMADVERQFDPKRQRREQESEAEKSRIANESRQRIIAIEEERKQALDALKDQKRVDDAQRKQKNADALAAAQGGLDEARANLDKLLADAKTKAASVERGAVERGAGAGPRPELPLPGEIAAAGKQKTSTFGTFSAFAVSGMGASSEMQRTAKATEKTAALLEQMERRRNRNGQKFVFMGADSPL